VAQKANLFENRFPYISVTAEASDFKFGMQLRFAKVHHQIPLEEKSGGGLGLKKLPKILGFPIIFQQRMGLVTSNLARCCGLPMPIIKSHPD